MTSDLTAGHPSWRAQLDRTLRDTFQIERLRDGQEAVISSVLGGQAATLAVMPTGAGKSLCYQVPALLLPGLTVVVSPLIALMKDQCDKLVEHGVAALQFNSSLRTAEIDEGEAALREGRVRIVFTTPERLADEAFISLLKLRPVSLLVVDEAHCISQWGHDFRPAFLEIGGAWRVLGKPPLLALTATATQAVVDDIRNQLQQSHLKVIDTGVYRENLVYRVEQATSDPEKLAILNRLLRELTGSGVVYAATVKAVEALHEALLKEGHRVGRYHGRLPAAERRAQQDAFMRDEVSLMVATNAFGLGIDKPDLRFVIHYQMPAGLDAYYQESGRCGRDGELAHCVLLHLHSDRNVQKFFLAQKGLNESDVQLVYQTLSRPPAGTADAAAAAGADTARRSSESSSAGPSAQAHRDRTHWDKDGLTAALPLGPQRVQRVLQLLRHQRLVTQARNGRLRLRHPGLAASELQAVMQRHEDKTAHDRAMLERMVFYGQTGYCRWKVLLQHFEEADGFDRCGRCDNCHRERMRALQLATDAVNASNGDAEVAVAAGVAASSPPGPRRAVVKPGFTLDEVVRVKRYGLGRIKAIEGDSLTVEFPEGQTRCFLSAYVQRAGRRAPRTGSTTAAA